MESLADIKPAKIEPAGKDGPDALTLNAIGTVLPMNLAGTLCTRGITLASGGSSTSESRRKIPHPELQMRRSPPLPPPRPVIVLADGRKVYKSRPRTSLDQPLTASVSIKDARTITLKVESTAGELQTTPGLWADPGLVK